MISILLASYNGEQFIARQIESLLHQTVQDFKLYICDDKSTDSTFSIIQEFANHYPDKIFITQNDNNLGGPEHNFIKMMMKHTDDYIMLCDQDDIWLPDKIEKSLRKIQENERIYGISMPLLVHTDLTVVDEELKTIYPSFVKASKAKYGKTKLNNIIVQNILTGCTAIYNRALARLVHKEPEYMIMHDWWLALIASSFGKISSIAEPTILYRQHENNDTGVNRRRPIEQLLHKMLNFNEVIDTLESTYRQADNFLKLYADRLSAGQKELIAAYATMPDAKKSDRIKRLIKYKTFKNGTIRKTAQIIAALTS